MHTRRTHFWDTGHLTACMEKEEFGVHNIHFESQFKDSGISCKHCWKPEGLHAHTEKPMIDYQNRENMDIKSTTIKLTPQPDKLQRRCALWKAGAAPTGTLYDARALVLTFGSRISPTELSRLLFVTNQDVAH